ncbi:MAG: hypothetical protein EOO71_09040 [Myxococcaceae bacterium]|nr:MAG: hypothetical protein EOO71_09040 [Myxococcaceae bacterium]
MARIKIDNLIIFGDSMSDIGNKGDTGLGMFANAVGLMQVNALGRFSDGKNWTDFLWEWAGGISMFRAADPFGPASSAKAQSLEATLVHRSLTVDSNQDSGFNRPITYVNYAEGGAMGASDRPSTGLGTFRDQVARFHQELRARPLVGTTMFIVWFGLNDLVTNKRPPGTMQQVVLEMFKLMNDLNTLAGGKAHFMLINLPDPADAARYAKEKTAPLVWGFTKGALLFNKVLAEFAAMGSGKTLLLVDMFTTLKTLNAELAKHNLVGGAQPGVVPINYPHVGPLVATPPTPVATSDKAHPTEAVYRLMARHIARTFVTRYELGTLSKNIVCKGVAVDADLAA